MAPSTRPNGVSDNLIMELKESGTGSGAPGSEFGGNPFAGDNGFAGGNASAGGNTFAGGNASAGGNSSAGGNRFAGGNDGDTQPQ